MITLFDYLPSQNAWKVRLLLTQLGLPYEQKFVRIFDGEGQSDEYLRISPRGTVPAILLSDGRALAESNVILSYLAEGSAFLPGDPYDKAKVLQWLMFEATDVQPSIAFLRFVKLTRAGPGAAGIWAAGPSVQHRPFVNQGLAVVPSVARAQGSRRARNDHAHDLTPTVNVLIMFFC